MTKRYTYFLALAGLFATVDLIAQKGIPSKVPTSATVSTHYPQHLDFKSTMAEKIRVPQGFDVRIAAQGLGKPRMIIIGENGDLYITRRDQGDVLLLRDINKDGQYEYMVPVMTAFKGVHGIATRDGFLYLVSNRILKRAKILSDGTLGKPETIFKDLPEGGQHPNRTLLFDDEGMLYITVGSDCNDCNESNPENATVLKVDLKTKHRSIYARGLRNTIGIDWQPGTKQLWGMDNGTDWRGDEIPPEELNKIEQDKHYGWPWIYGKQQVDQTREEPIGTTKEDFAKTTEASVMEFPAHSAPINFKFLDKAGSFPQDYRDDALVSFHGSWNRSKPEGYKVVRIIFENGLPVRTEDFFSGLLSEDGETRFGRPAGIAIGPDSRVYITDDENGVVYSVGKK